MSVGPEEERYEAKAVLAALGNVGHVLAESLQGKDPTMQAMLDKTLMSESSLPANAVSAASIACCKAGAKQALTSVYDHVAIMSNNSEGVIPAPAFSIINGGRLSSSSLWVQVGDQDSASQIRVSESEEELLNLLLPAKEGTRNIPVQGLLR